MLFDLGSLFLLTFLSISILSSPLPTCFLTNLHCASCFRCSFDTLLYFLYYYRQAVRGCRIFLCTCRISNWYTIRSFLTMAVYGGRSGNIHTCLDEWLEYIWYVVVTFFCSERSFFFQFTSGDISSNETLLWLSSLNITQLRE